MNSDEIAEAAVEETKSSFDLGAFVKGRPLRFKSVTVYTDEEAGEELGGAEEERNLIGALVGKRRWGVLGEADELREHLDSIDEEGADEDDPRRTELNEAILALKPRVEAALAKLNASALTIEVQTLPPIIRDAARKKARKNLGIKGTLKPDDERAEEFLHEYNVLILEACIVSITNADGQENRGVDRDGAETLLGFLPDSEIAKLQALVEEVVFKSSIASHLATDADF